MTSGSDRSEGVELRRRAEEIARGKAALAPEETRGMLHELQVHQIELEVQNEELRRTQAELESARARYFDLYDLAPVGYCTVGESGLILEANLTAATLLGMARGTLGKQPIARFILKDNQDLFYLRRKRLLDTGEPQACELRMVEVDGTVFWAQLAMTAAQEADGAPVLRVVLSDITKRKLAEEALRKASNEIRTLRGIIPICSNCKKIRDDKGYWNQVDVYVRDHTEAEFTHGMCPECMRQLYPGFERDAAGSGPQSK